MQLLSLNTDLEAVLNQPKVIIFYNANWSGYALIAEKKLINIEKNNIIENIKFYSGQLEDNLQNLAKTLMAKGVSKNVFSGAGSISIFKNGIHQEDVISITQTGHENLIGKFRHHFVDS